MPFSRLLKFGEKSKGSDQPDQDTGPLPEVESSEAQVEPEKKTLAPAENIEENETEQSFYEIDNRAIRIQRLSQANDFWSEYEKSRPQIPFLRYGFTTELQAIEALLSISCIHRAVDTGQIICTEPITLGWYRNVDGHYEVFLAGEKLTYRVWSEASEKFKLLKGRYYHQLRPETYERFKGKFQDDQVVFKKESCELGPEETKHYLVFESPRLLAAKNFLLRQENIITEPNRYIYVVTPKGIVFRDRDGIHESAETRFPALGLKDLNNLS